MKTLKKIVIAFLVLLLIDMIIALAISFNLKKILVNGVMKEAFTERIMVNNYNSPKYTITDEQIDEITDDEMVREILKSKEIEDLLNKYLDNTIDGLIDYEDLDEVELEKDMLKFLKDNRKVLEEKIGKQITDEMIENATKEVEYKDLTRAYKQSIQNASRNMSESEKNILKGYKFLISLKFKILMFILIIIDLVSIAILQKSTYKWIKTFSKASIISGVSIVIMSIITNIIVKNSSAMKSFNTNNLTITGIIILLLGLLIYIGYKIVSKKIIKRKEDESDIS